MGLRDNMKKAVGTVAAGIRSALHAPRGVLQARSAIRVTATDASLRAVPIPASFALAPSAARAMDSGVITQPRLVLPSQLPLGPINGSLGGAAGTWPSGSAPRGRLAVALRVASGLVLSFRGRSRLERTVWRLGWSPL